MPEKQLRIEIATPQSYRSFDEATSCSAPGVMGRFQILTRHAPFVSQLTLGDLIIKTPDATLYFATSGGFLQVLDNTVLCLLDTCEPAEEIDVERAKAAAERARERLKRKGADVDVQRARAALFRALNRIKISEKVSERV